MGLDEYIQQIRDITLRCENMQKSDMLMMQDLSIQESIESIKISTNELVDAFNEGLFRGEPGEPGAPGVDGIDGEDGREIELTRNQTHIIWRYVGDVDFTELVSLDELRPPSVVNGDAYTKAETDAKIEEVIAPIRVDVETLKENSGSGYKGIIGDGAPPSCYFSEPASPHGAAALQYIIRFKTKEDEKYYIFYIKTGNNVTYPYLTAKETYDSFYLGTSSYVKGFVYSDATGWTSTSLSQFTVKPKNNFLFYTTTKDVVHFNSVEVANGEIVFGVQPELDLSVIGDYNLATNMGTYRVKHSTLIDNAPSSEVDGVMNVIVANTATLQEVTTKTTSHKRMKSEGVWGEWL